MRNILMVMVSMLAACGGGEEAPSCQQALTHYYGSGCSYTDGSVTPPRVIPQGEMTTFCQTAAIEIPDSCQGELDAWLVCNNEVPTPSTTTSQCDCSTEFMALLRCD